MIIDQPFCVAFLLRKVILSSRRTHELLKLFSRSGMLVQMSGSSGKLHVSHRRACYPIKTCGARIHPNAVSECFRLRVGCA